MPQIQHNFISKLYLMSGLLDDKMQDEFISIFGVANLTSKSKTLVLYI